MKRAIFSLSIALSPVLLFAQSSGIQRSEPVNLGAVGAGEGPAWGPDNTIYFSGPKGILHRSADGQVKTFRDGAGGANGLMFDREGRLVTCEARNRRITRTEKNGTITILADRFEGKLFNSPNDLTIDSKGRIYFTDPRYGKRDGMEILDAGGKPIEGVYRIDGPGKVTRIISHEVDRPNGVLVSPDDRYLYVADNNNNHHVTRQLYRFDLKKDGAIDPASKKEIYSWENGRGPDGLKMDIQGRLFVAGGLNKPNQYEPSQKFKSGVYVLSPEGKLLDFIAIPIDEATNCAFGGNDLKTLYITAGGTLWSVNVDVPGYVNYKRKSR